MEFTWHSLKTIQLKTWLLVLSLFIVAIFCSLYADCRLGYQVLSGDQLFYKVFTDVMSNPHVYALDPVYAYPQNTQVYTPLFLQLIKPAYNTFGYLNGLVFCQPFISMAYLLSMFCLIYKSTGKVLLSVFVAIVSAAKIPAFPVDHWGALSLYLVMPRTLFLIFVPLLFYGWLKYQDNIKVLAGVFFTCGLLTHLHPVSGVTLSAVMLFAQFYKSVLKKREYKTYCLFILATILPVVPFAFHYFGHTQEGIKLDANQFAYFFDCALRRYSYLQPFLGFPSNLDVLFTTVTMTCMGVVAFLKAKKYIPERGLIILFCLGCILIYVAFYAINFLVLFPKHIPPVLIDLPRVIKFLLLPTFFSIGICLARIEKKSVLILACIAFFVIFNVINYDILLGDIKEHPGQIGRLFQHQLENYISTHGGPMTTDQKETKTFLLANENMAFWIKANTVSEKTLIHVGVDEKKHSAMMLRALSERAITLANKDGGLLYYTDKHAFINWGHNMEKINEIRHLYGECSNAEIQFARKNRATYLVCKNNVQNLALQKLYQNNVFCLYQL